VQNNPQTLKGEIKMKWTNCYTQESAKYIANCPTIARAYGYSTNYKPNQSYKILEFKNGFGDIWYEIQIKGIFFNKCFKCWHPPYSESFIPSFKSKEDIKDFFIALEKEYSNYKLKNTITIQESSM